MDYNYLFQICNKKEKSKPNEKRLKTALVHPVTFNYNLYVTQNILYQKWKSNRNKTGELNG